MSPEGGGRPLHLHVGLPKTASTFLQAQVFSRLDHLAVRSMPRTRLFDAAGDAAAEFRTFACVLRRSVAVWEARSDAILDELLGPAGAPRGILVSDEAIGRAASRPEALAAHLRAFASAARARGFARPRIVAFLRRQDHWLASHYAQISNSAFAASQAGFEAMVARTLDPARDRFGFGMLLDYAALRDTLTAVAGDDGVLLLPQEALAAEPAATLCRLLGWIGTPPARTEVLIEAAGARANVRSEAVDGQPTWRLRPPSIAVGRGRRLEVSDRLWPARRIALARDLSARILRSYAESNRRLAQATGLDLDRWGYFGSTEPA